MSFVWLAPESPSLFVGWLSAGRRHGVLPPALSPPPGVACRIFWAPPSPSTYPPPPHCRPVGPLLLLTPLVLLETRPPPRSPPPTRPTTLGNGVAFHTSALDACCCIGGSRCTHLWRVPARPGPPPWAQAPLVRVFFLLLGALLLGRSASACHGVAAAQRPPGGGGVLVCRLGFAHGGGVVGAAGGGGCCCGSAGARRHHCRGVADNDVAGGNSCGVGTCCLPSETARRRCVASVWARRGRVRASRDAPNG